jgi:hypothetical protein
MDEPLALFVAGPDRPCAIPADLMPGCERPCLALAWASDDWRMRGWLGARWSTFAAVESRSRLPGTSRAGISEQLAGPNGVFDGQAGASKPLQVKLAAPGA